MTEETIKVIDGYEHVQYHPRAFTPDITLQKSLHFYQDMDLRRTVRDFSDKPVDRAVIENIIKTASTAPSGAHKQPWTFCAISNPAIKKEIRKAAEQEEYESYHGRMSERWLKDLAPIGTNWSKPFLETAPWIVVVFKKAYDKDTEGEKINNYYVNESVGIACGMFITAVHMAGLVTLTHTPSPMNFLSKILDRPDNERPYLLLPVGYAADEVYVPKLTRKPLEEVAKFY
ncbi:MULTISPECIES: nitroreductase family protein [unclassified Imperialibacter]|uniref:nitroreductase family protein n=1 Tax=unclassified Imperialibacter TaxID=2629706 RepID=UPI00125A36AE|nr:MULTISPECIES: nitroreductase family protein [unclassified Imperialibacter]CAD5277879.1 Nitroreductase family protein [Imperialibacter sp. 89]CAD5292169.1 Nitroreductase family protein [Imperialibacter sp. 75]VVT00087.1 Nitroreductase family protein [Imperialibacter sp. EC-SDR9]